VLNARKNLLRIVNRPEIARQAFATTSVMLGADDEKSSWFVAEIVAQGERPQSYRPVGEQAV
jgi:hypothetical protein